MYFVILANAFDKSIECLGVHCTKGLAEAQASHEQVMIKNNSEWVKVIKLKEYRRLRANGLVTA